MFQTVILISMVIASPLFAEEWRTAQPHYPWSFPQDHWARTEYKTEWWYFTGHLETATGQKFGYQFTFFRVGLMPQKSELNSEWATNQLIMGHAAISNLNDTTHVFSEVLYRTTPLLGGFGVFPDTLIAWSRGPTGTAKKWTLQWNGVAFDFSMADNAQDMAFELQTYPQKPLILQGPNGYSRKGKSDNAASQYYSFTRLKTQGKLTVGGETAVVTGASWMDKEFGSNQLGDHQTGWDWFSLQLNDGRDVMLYILRDSTGATDYARGTWSDAEGRVHHLSRGDFDVRATTYWKSPNTHAQYPTTWQVQINGQVWQVIAMMANQENRGSRIERLFYWEGAVSVRDLDGKQVGKGYVELTGYGTGMRPGI